MQLADGGRQSFGAGVFQRNLVSRSDPALPLADLVRYVPAQQFDVVLLRESTYRVPMSKIRSMLDRYSQYLRSGGVFIVRMELGDSMRKVKFRPSVMMSTIENGFDVVEKCEYEDSEATVVVVRPKGDERTGAEARQRTDHGPQ